MTPLHSAVPTARRALGDTLAELALGLLALAASGPARATGIELQLPLELQLSGEDAELLGDLPRSRRATAFDAPPAQVTIVLTEVAL